MASTARLIIVCGLPGAGKTTLAKRFEDRRGAIRLCPDEWMEQLGIGVWDEAARTKVERLQWALGRQLLRLGQTVVVEWGTWGRAERDALRAEARALGAAVELHYVRAPVHVLVERLSRRATEDPPIRREQLQQWAAMFDVPDAGELALYDEPTQP